MMFFFFQAEDGIRDIGVTGVQTCALPIYPINLVPLAAGIIIAIGNNRSGDTPLLVFSEEFSLGGIALGTIVAVAGWHIARALAPADMKAALTREGAHPAAGTTFGHVHGAEIGPDVIADRDRNAYHEAPDPSSVDEVGRPGVPHNR